MLLRADLGPQQMPVPPGAVDDMLVVRLRPRGPLSEYPPISLVSVYAPCGSGSPVSGRYAQFLRDFSRLGQVIDLHTAIIAGDFNCSPTHPDCATWQALCAHAGCMHLSPLHLRLGQHPPATMQYPPGNLRMLDQVWLPLAWNTTGAALSTLPPSPQLRSHHLAVVFTLQVPVLQRDTGPHPWDLPGPLPHSASPRVWETYLAKLAAQAPPDLATMTPDAWFGALVTALRSAFSAALGPRREPRVIRLARALLHRAGRQARRDPAEAHSIALASRALSRAIRTQRRLSSPLGQFRAGRPTTLLRGLHRRPPSITSLLPDDDARPLMRTIFFEWTATHTPQPTTLPPWLHRAYRLESGVYEAPDLVLSHPITDAEWSLLTGSLGSRASGPGPSGLRFSHLLRVPPSWLAAIRAYLDSCITACSIPEVLSRALLYPIPKSSTATSVSDLRPISMMETLLKTLTQLLFLRLATALGPRLSPFQFGLDRKSVV